MTGGSSAETLARRINGLVGRYTALSTERRTQATRYKAEASYLFGAAAAFEVVATELWEALGKHGAVPRDVRASHPAPVELGESGPAASAASLGPVELAEAGTVRDPRDARGTT